MQGYKVIVYYSQTFFSYTKTRWKLPTSEIRQPHKHYFGIRDKKVLDNH